MELILSLPKGSGQAPRRIFTPGTFEQEVARSLGDVRRDELRLACRLDEAFRGRWHSCTVPGDCQFGNWLRLIEMFIGDSA